jgi:hypothetical protein
MLLGQTLGPGALPKVSNFVVDSNPCSAETSRLIAQ